MTIAKNADLSCLKSGQAKGARGEQLDTCSSCYVPACCWCTCSRPSHCAARSCAYSSFNP
jgi:hypothetical protein